MTSVGDRGSKNAPASQSKASPNMCGTHTVLRDIYSQPVLIFWTYSPPLALALAWLHLPTVLVSSVYIKEFPTSFRHPFDCIFQPPWLVLPCGNLSFHNISSFHVVRIQYLRFWTQLFELSQQYRGSMARVRRVSKPWLGCTLHSIIHVLIKLRARHR